MKLKEGERGTFVALGIDGDDLGDGLEIHGIKELEFSLLKSDVKGVTIGTATSDTDLVNKNVSMPFIPASITKIVTAAASLRSLGPEFRFTTNVRWILEPDGTTARDLIVIADGDPQVALDTKGSEASRKRLDEIATSLKDSGIVRVTGRLTLLSQDERKDTVLPSPGLPEEDFNKCYASFAQSFNIRSSSVYWNCGSVAVRGLGKAGWTDANLRFPLNFKMFTGEATSLRFEPQFDPMGVIGSYLVRGAWHPQRTSLYYGSVPISNVKPWYGRSLVAALKRHGIDVSDVTLFFPTGEMSDSHISSVLGHPSSKSFSVYSDPVYDLIRFMNKPSENYFADALFKALGSLYKSLENDIRFVGEQAIRESVREWLVKQREPHLSSEVRLLDGSGLSRDNRTTPRAFLSLMRELTREPWFPHLLNSLPVAGEDGTLDSRMKGTVAQGRVYAKTGTLKGAYQIAGYIPKYGSDSTVVDYVPFVILSETSEGQKTRVRNFQDQLIVRLVKVVNPSLRDPDDVATPTSN